MEFLHELPEHRLVEKLAKPQSIFYRQFGIPEPFCWVGIRLPLPELVPSMRGDVDLCWGPMIRSIKATSSKEGLWVFQRYGSITKEFLDGSEWIWPPRLDRLEAFEFKTHPVHVDGHVRRKGDQSKPRSSGDQQAKLLCRAGFDRVTLVDLMAAEPADALGSNPWLSGAAVAGKGSSVLRREIRLREKTPYGRVVCEWSQVSWKDPEHAGGFGVPRTFRGSPANHLLGLEDVMKNRNMLNERFAAIFSRFHSAEVPFPVFLRYCGKCRSFYTTKSPDQRHCIQAMG